MPPDRSRREVGGDRPSSTSCAAAGVAIWTPKKLKSLPGIEAVLAVAVGDDVIGVRLEQRVHAGLVGATECLPGIGDARTATLRCG